MTARRVFLCAVALASLVLPVRVYGQTSQSALAGVVRDSTGGVTNMLEVQVAPTAVSYLINGAVVHATPTRAGTGSYTEGEKTHGVAGIRIDGAVDLQVDGFEVQQPFTPPVRGQ